jgi:hypothetical protein
MLVSPSIGLAVIDMFASAYGSILHVFIRLARCDSDALFSSDGPHTNAVIA